MNVYKTMAPQHRLMFCPDLERFTRPALWSVPAEISLAQEQLHQRLRDSIAHDLTQKQREAVELFFFEGLSQGQIARRLGVTQQIISKRIYGTQRKGRMVGGALRRLRTVLEQPARVCP